MNTRKLSRVSWMFAVTMLMCPVISGAQEEASDAVDATSTEAAAPASMSDLGIQLEQAPIGQREIEVVVNLAAANL